MITVIGVDCATNARKVGLALARFDGRVTTLQEVVLGDSKRTPVEVVHEWLKASSRPALLALDAPLGWPQPLSDVLCAHRAGERLSENPEIDAHRLFRRLTDRTVKESCNKQSLDVGADRIARTAHAALELLGALRKRLRARIPLAWSPELKSISAIEVYPAATLRAHEVDAAGYKAAGDPSSRRRVLKQLGAKVSVPAGLRVPDLESGSDGLDAVLCVLAAHDFLTGRAMRPAKDQLRLARKEGWIWVHQRAQEQ